MLLHHVVAINIYDVLGCSPHTPLQTVGNTRFCTSDYWYRTNMTLTIVSIFDEAEK